MMYLVASIASFGTVFFKAIQGRNFAHGNYLAVVPTSIGVAACDIYVLSLIVKDSSLAFVICVGLGSGLGGMLGMAADSHFRKRNP